MSNNVSPQEIISIIKKYKLPFSNEKECQEAIEKILPFAERHKRLSGDSIPDFMCGETVIEVKIKGSPMAIYKQCERYLSFDSTKALILVTGKTMGMPKEINGKPVFVVFLGQGWL